jgi:hypothetical protein
MNRLGGMQSGTGWTSREGLAEGLGKAVGANVVGGDRLTVYRSAGREAEVGDHVGDIDEGTGRPG